LQGKADPAVMTTQLDGEPLNACSPVSMSLHPLKGEAIRSAEAVGRYLYVRAGHRYAIDLLHGRVVRPVRSDARIARASFFRIPSPTCERG
jgi:hypothetical protein